MTSQFDYQLFVQQQLLLMSQLYQIQNQTQQFDQTLFIYDIYDENKITFLKNLKYIPLTIIEKSLKLKGQKGGSKKSAKFYFESSEIEFDKNPYNRRKQFKIDPTTLDQEPSSLTSAYIYQGILNQKKIRIVTLPLSSDLISIQSLQAKATQLLAFDNACHDRTQTISGEELTKQRQNNKKERLRKITEWTNQQRRQNIKLFRIDALVKLMSEKSKQVGFACLADLSTRDLKSYRNDIARLFFFDKEKVQFIVHSQDETEPSKDLNDNQISMIVYLDENDNGKIVQKGLFEKKNFTQDKHFRTKLYQIRQCKGRIDINPYLSANIQQFVQNWNSICFNSSTCIGTILKATSSEEKMDNDLSKELISNQESKLSDHQGQEIIIYTFNEIFEKFINLQNLKFKKDVQFDVFFNENRLLGISIDKDQAVIPKTIEPLVFLHYFTKINQQFLERYAEIEMKSKDRTQVLKYALDYLKVICQLVNEINSTYLKRLDGGIHACEDLKKYYNFIVFLYNSMELIKSITHRQFALAASLSTFFKKIMPKKIKLIEYIIKCEGLIKKHQPIHYYDLYLKMIAENQNEIEKGKIDFILLKLHYYKASRISIQYIYDNSRVVQAINSFSKIVADKHSIPQGKRHILDVHDIEKKIAALLLIVGLPDYAIQIYKKNHMTRSVEKCIYQILFDYSGDEKALKEIKFAEYFLKQFEPEKALQFYKRAYQSANDIELKRLSIQGKFKSYDFKTKTHEDQRRMFDRYINRTADFQQFIGNSTENKKQQQLAEKLVGLYWNETSNKAQFSNQPSN